MATGFLGLLRQGKTFLTPKTSASNLRNGSEAHSDHDFASAKEGQLFPRVDPAVDGEDCLHDCDSCTIKYSAKFKIDEDKELYGHIEGWATHLLVATGKTDWTKHVEDEKGSVMQAIGKADVEPSNGKLKLSASDMPLPDPDKGPYEQPTRCLLLPSFTVIDGVTPQNAEQLLTTIVSSAPTNTTPLHDPSSASPLPEVSAPFTTRPWPHDALILLCSQRSRDGRCGQSAPLLRREFERQLRPLGLYRDLHDSRPGGVGVYFVSHVGGHKFSANVLIYRRAGLGQGTLPADSEGHKRQEEGDRSAAQCIWLARVRPNECEGIVKYTLLQGKVVKPERQLRGGFDRERQICSW